MDEWSDRSIFVGNGVERLSELSCVGFLTYLPRGSFGDSWRPAVLAHLQDIDAPASSAYPPPVN